MKDLFSSFYIMNIFLPGITYSLLTKTDTTSGKKINFPTVSSYKRIPLDIPTEHFVLPVENYFMLSVVFKKKNTAQIF